MAFDLYTFVTPAAGLKAGDSFALPYAAGRALAKYRPAGLHLAKGPNNLLVAAPTKFTVAFNVPSIAITWNGPVLGPAVVLKFQFESVDGNIGLDGKEIAHASGDNITFPAPPAAGAPVDSPAFTGNPTAPTPAPGDNDTSVATTAFVASAVSVAIAAAIAALVNSSPAALDTLNELAAALGNDANFATTMTNALALKAPKADPMFTGTTNATQGLKVSGDLVPTALVADVNDYAPAGFSAISLLRLTANAAPRTVTGLAGGQHGRLIRLHNVGTTYAIVLAHENAASTGNNRFSFGANRTLEPGRAMWLLYDANDNRWLDFELLSPATTALLLAAANTERFVTPAVLFGGAAPVAVAYAATVTLDLTTGVNFDIGQLTGNINLANPSAGMTPGRSGRIRIQNDAATPRILLTGTWWKAPGGAQSLTATINAIDCIYYFVRDATTIEYTIAKAFS